MSGAARRAAPTLRSSPLVLRGATGGARLVSPDRPIAAPRAAMNGRAYGSPELVAHYRNAATGRSQRRDFEERGHFGVPNGGMSRPRDAGIWNGRLVRVCYAPPGAREAEVVERGTNGPWYMSPAVIREIVRSSGSASDLLEMLRYQLALGHPLEMETMRLVEVQVAGPIAALAGRGNPTSAGYDQAAFPTLAGNPTLEQLFIPGIRDRNDQPDDDVIANCFDYQATNSYDAVGAFVRYGGIERDEQD